MNERLRELEKLSVYYNEDEETWEFDREKFAELIVQECVNIAHPKLTDVGEWAAGMRLVQKRIKENFGVE